MKPLGTSIRLFLAEGSPDGVWVVEKANWTGIAVMAHRARYASLRKRPELDGTGVYVLVGPAENDALPTRIYVGKSDVLRDRLDNHQRNKDFWTKVVAFTSKDANLNKAHVRYLESRLIQLASEAARAELENSSGANLPSLSEPDRADVEAFLADMLLLFEVLGVTAFEKPAEEPDNPRLYLESTGVKAEGRETADGFIVYAGAIARRETTSSMKEYRRSLRDKLIEARILVPEGDHLRLTQDYLFSAPSAAATVLLGRSTNGRTAWRDEKGRTLKEMQELATRD
ncbi:MAG: methionine sulfoxide reductase [Acidimicrobiales bacterium]|nr:MAG: methionine sulfoxide reductase [Acidimicrobiales bacterium]